MDLKLDNSLVFLAPANIKNMIRLGRYGDGGYVIPEYVLSNTDALISLGISTDWSFDSDWYKLNPSKIHAYDGTIDPSTFDLVLKEQFNDFFKNNVALFKSNVGIKQGEVRLETVIDNIASEKIFLKMDIEGSEYGLISSILNASDKIVGMVIEFHAISLLREQFASSIKSLQEHYDIVHIHANNFGGVCDDKLPHTLEITFLKHEFSVKERRYHAYLENLDTPNCISEEDYKIYFGV